MFDDNQMEEERRLCYVGITRAKKKLFMTHARTRMLYNNRQANQISRFVSEIPTRLIQGGRAGGAMRIPPAAPGLKARQSYDRRPAANAGSLGIPGVQKGFGGGSAPAQPTQNLFSVGDRVMHRMFGPGTVMELAGTGNAQRARIKFDSGTERIFAVNAAPILKMRK